MATAWQEQAARLAAQSVMTTKQTNVSLGRGHVSGV